MTEGLTNRYLKAGVSMLTIVLAFCAAAFAQSPKAEETLHANVDKLFAQWDKPDSPGCALGVIRDGKLVYKRGYGLANLDHNIPLSSSSVFYIASTSKQFTAMSIALLARKGAISLDDDIRKYLPELPAYETPVTIRNLIHHTSGVRDYLSLWPLAGVRHEDVHDDNDVLEFLSRQKLNFRPGEESLYSNSGYLLLGVIVKRVSGKSLREFAEENIFKPFGMTSTRFYDDRRVVVKNRVTSYAAISTGFSRYATNFDLVGDGGLLTTVDDLFKWDQNFYENKIGGGQQLIEQILTPGVLSSGEKLNYAFGLVSDVYKGLKVIRHAGGFYAFRAEMIRFPEQKFTVICLCNVDTALPTTMVFNVADLYLADKLEVAKAEPAVAVEPFKLSEQQLIDKVGPYRDPTDGEIWTLFSKQGKLFVAGPGLTLIPISTTEFRSSEVPSNVYIRFEDRVDSNRPDMLVQRQGSKTATFRPIKYVSPTASEMGELAGDYYSEELQTTYKIAVDGAKLVVKIKNSPKAVLYPTVRDEFRFLWNIVIFSRDPQYRVTGFSLNSGRVRGIGFVKRKSTPD
jgi:CubicO group peptidase (beta-lactamase class C family)